MKRECAECGQRRNSRAGSFVPTARICHRRRVSLIPASMAFAMSHPAAKTLNGARKTLVIVNRCLGALFLVGPSAGGLISGAMIAGRHRVDCGKASCGCRPILTQTVLGGLLGISLGLAVCPRQLLQHMRLSPDHRASWRWATFFSTFGSSFYFHASTLGPRTSAFLGRQSPARCVGKSPMLAIARRRRYRRSGVCRPCALSFPLAATSDVAGRWNAELRRIQSNPRPRRGDRGECGGPGGNARSWALVLFRALMFERGAQLTDPLHRILSRGVPAVPS